MKMPILSESAATYFSSYTLPLGLKFDADTKPWDGVRPKRATFTLVNAGNRHCFITCNHVLVELEQMCKTTPNVQLVAYLACPSLRELSELFDFRYLDRNASPLDIAIFMGREDFVEIPEHNFIDYPNMITRDIEIGDAIAVAGYPAANISVSPNKAFFDFTYLVQKATSVSPNRVVLANSEGKRIFTDYSDHPRERIDYGGLSGSPAFRISNGGDYSFIGIVTECSEPDQTIFISRLTQLKPNGTLDHLAI